MTWIPSPGLLLIRRPTITHGGSIVLLDKTVEGWTAGQAEIIAVGPPERPDDPEEEILPVDPRFIPGAWILTRGRSWVSGAEEGQYLIRQSDVVAVLYND